MDETSRYLIPWLIERIKNRDFLGFLEWEDENKMILRYREKRTKKDDTANLELFIAWAKYKDKFHPNLKFSLLKHRFRQALRSNEKMGLVKEQKKKNGWYYWKIVNQNKRKKNRKEKLQQTQPNISNEQKQAESQRYYLRCRPKAEEPMTIKSSNSINKQIQHDQVSSTTLQLQYDVSSHTNNLKLPEIEKFSNLDQQLWNFNQEGLNQNSFNNIHSEYLPSSDAIYINGTTSIYSTNMSYDITPTNIPYLHVMVPQTTGRGESLCRPKNNEDFPFEFVQDQLVNHEMGDNSEAENIYLLDIFE